MADRDELLDHNYDGIQEYDNDLPKWWVWLFWITVIYGVGYSGYYHLGPGLNQDELIALEMEKHEAIVAKAESEKGTAEITDDSLLALVNDSAAMERGKEMYAAKCAACHAAEGQGLVGPNLTDDYWVHGGSITDIHKIVTDGVVEKGMLAWKGQISDQQINEVVAFIWTLRGTNPPNPKKAEGELVPRSES